MSSLKVSAREKLQKISTATIATCLYKKGLRNQFIQKVKPLKKGKPNMVGEAFTLRYIPAREDLNPVSVFRVATLGRYAIDVVLAISAFGRVDQEALVG